MTPFLCLWILSGAAADKPREVPDKTIVLTFDDAVRSHVDYVAPLLKDYGFGATFFITHLWMSDTENFLSWEDVATIHNMGFEIGNHTWTHAGQSQPKAAARLEAELALIDNALKKAGVPKPVSFAWPGNGFCPESVEVLENAGIRFARRGMQPEVPYGEATPGPLFDPSRHHPLLIPTAGDAYPNWTLDHFKAVVDRARDGKIAVVQFHGVPDIAHPWVHTPPEQFPVYMEYLKSEGFNVIALRDVAQFLPDPLPLDDPMLGTVHPIRTPEKTVLPVEVAATQANLPFWLENMLVHHKYSIDESAAVAGLPAAHIALDAKSPQPSGPRIMPYPGGRHPRLGFFDGAICPQRGTKLSVFAPWNNGGYAVLDVPEAIFSNLGLIFLAHTHIPTIWDDQSQIINNVDWQPGSDGKGWQFERELPNGIRFGTTATPTADGVDVDLWLENNTTAPLTDLRTQVCLMLGRLDGFQAQSNDNKQFEDAVAAANSADGQRRVTVEFDHVGRVWGNPKCPCIHSDPVFPDAAPGEIVHVRGKVRFDQT